MPIADLLLLIPHRHPPPAAQPRPSIAVSGTRPILVMAADEPSGSGVPLLRFDATLWLGECVTLKSRAFLQGLF